MYIFRASKLITSSLKIPTVGIGSYNCDGQIGVKKYTKRRKIKKFPTTINNFLNGK